jgi:hypothetical protein
MQVGIYLAQESKEQPTYLRAKATATVKSAPG